MGRRDTQHPPLIQGVALYIMFSLLARIQLKFKAVTNAKNILRARDRKGLAVCFLIKELLPTEWFLLKTQLGAHPDQPQLLDSPKPVPGGLLVARSLI